MWSSLWGFVTKTAGYVATAAMAYPVVTAVVVVTAGIAIAAGGYYYGHYSGRREGIRSEAPKIAAARREKDDLSSKYVTVTNKNKLLENDLNDKNTTITHLSKVVTKNNDALQAANKRYEDLKKQAAAAENKKTITTAPTVSTSGSWQQRNNPSSTPATVAPVLTYKNQFPNKDSKMPAPVESIQSPPISPQQKSYSISELNKRSGYTYK